MKKIYGFLGAAAILSMVACSKNADLGGGNVPNGGTAGDMFMTMNIAMASQVGTRTTTPNQGYEVGQVYENTISSALVILAQKKEGAAEGYTIKFASGNIGSNDLIGDNTTGGTHDENDGTVAPNPSHTSTYKTSFKLDRASVLKDIKATGTDAEGESNHTGKKKEYYIFVIANPTAAMISAATPDESSNPDPDLQQVFAVFADQNVENAPLDNGYWKNHNFLMSSAAPAKHTIYEDEIPEGTHTTKAEAYNLGKVYVQRAMSRFDLAIDNNHIEFEGEGDTNPEGTGAGVPGIKVKFDAVAMVNMAKSAYLFKVMSETEPQKTNGATHPTSFGDERESTFSDFWTVTPKQGSADNAYYNQLFEGMTGEGSNLSYSEEGGENKALESFFDSGADFQTISQDWAEDNTFEHEQHTPGVGNYKIWRYAMENTNPFSEDDQVNGNSTGVIFRAIMTGTKIPTEGDDPIYAYNNVILGTAEELFTYATTPKSDSDDSGVYEAVRNIYWGIINPLYEANKKTPAEGEFNYDTDWKSKSDAWWIEKKTTGDAGSGGTISYEYHHPESLSSLDEKLVEQGFNIYRPKTVDAKPVYYSYYIYWNRHNDNNKNTVMGIMEFATVRNNVYKLSVNKVLRLGHPGQPGDDPYPPTPGTPDEQDTFWLEVECHVLPWEVRINNIEF